MRVSSSGFYRINGVYDLSAFTLAASAENPPPAPAPSSLDASTSLNKSRRGLNRARAAAGLRAKSRAAKARITLSRSMYAGFRNHIITGIIRPLNYTIKFPRVTDRRERTGRTGRRRAVSNSSPSSIRGRVEFGNETSEPGYSLHIALAHAASSRSPRRNFGLTAGTRLTADRQVSAIRTVSDVSTVGLATGCNC